MKGETYNNVERWSEMLCKHMKSTKRMPNWKKRKWPIRLEREYRNYSF